MDDWSWVDWGIAVTIYLLVVLVMLAVFAINPEDYDETRIYRHSRGHD